MTKIEFDAEYLRLVKELGKCHISAYCRNDLDRYQAIVDKIESLESQYPQHME